jgi:hypothetical protein
LILGILQKGMLAEEAHRGRGILEKGKSRGGMLHSRRKSEILKSGIFRKGISAFLFGGLCWDF